ncbi:MAG: PAS domain-containing protein, partial [bacterium]
MSKTSPKNKERKQKTKDKGQTEYLVTGKEIRKLTEKCMNKLETMLVILDPRGRIIMLNKQGYKILGYKEGELLGKYWFNTCLPEDERTKVEKVFKKILHGKIKQLKHYENLIITKKGNTKQIEWFNSLLKNNKREIVGVLSSGKDISLDKEQIEKERNAELIRNANSIMLRWKKDKKIEFINDFGLKT